MKLILTKEQAQAILYEETDEFKIISDNVVGQRRWSTVHKLIVQRFSDSKYFMARYSKGSTETQDETPWEYDQPDFQEVEPKEKVIIEYVVVKDTLSGEVV